MLSLADVEEVKKNWPKYRCRPNVMPFASLYGHDIGENFNFCLMNMFGTEMGAALGPVFVILGSIVSALVTLIQVANSIRVQFATMMGGINTLFQNFADRFKQLLSAVQMTAYRMKLIMGRLYGAFFAMIYMSIAGMTSMQNFTESILFDFLDTFCFDPDTPVNIQNKGSIPIKDVKINDVFEQTGSRVTATFQFQADGQSMVKLPGDILVSTNHYIYYLGKWIQAVDHPQAIPAGRWKGGNTRPLICLNTSDHKIPIGHYVFLDYDETEEGDKETMQWIDTALNGKPSHYKRSYMYTSSVYGDTDIQMQDGSSKSIKQICLGDILTTGRVVGIVKKQIQDYCELSLDESVTPGLTYWQKNQWVRAGDLLSIKQLNYPQTWYSLVVLGSGCFETKKGTFMRDYVEVHSPDAEQFYTRKIKHLGESSIETLPAY